MLIRKHFSSPLFSKIYLNILKYFHEKASQIDGKEWKYLQKSLRTKSQFSSMRPILPNAVLLKLCSIRAPRRPYGQNGDFSDLPVNASPRLRKAPSFGCFHRSRHRLAINLVSLWRIRKHRFFTIDSSVETTRNDPFGIYVVLYRFRNRRFWLLP